MAERRKAERRGAERRVAGPRLKTARQDIMNAAKNFQWNHPMPSWTTIVEGREFPARPLVLKAARVSDQHPVNAVEAAVILSDLGFEVRFKGAVVAHDDLPA